MCSKPVSLTNLDPEVELFCQECRKNLTRLDGEFEDNTRTQRRIERRDRDDEEEWRRVPIPQSDDSEDEPWFGESNSSESEQDGEDITPTMGNKKGFSQNVLTIVSNPLLVNKQSTEDFAFRNGPRRDGIIRRKDGSLITIDECPYPEQRQPRKPLEREKGLPETGLKPPRWSPLLLTLQNRKLKMKYKSKTKVRAKLMRSIRKHVIKKEHI
jgi:hypothetical protein